MEGLKFEHEGMTYNVPCMPNKYWREALLYYGDCPARLVVCQDSMCYCCIYHRGNQKARKAFYYECFPEEKPVEVEKSCKECANYKPKEEPKKRPKLTREVFGREDCPMWAKWATVDEDGECFVWSTMPVLGYGVWLCPDHIKADRQYIPAKRKANSTREDTLWDASDWRNSIIFRPNLPRYMVVRNKDFNLFRRNVQQMVEEGWKLEGGAVKDDEHYMQTLIKED